MDPDAPFERRNAASPRPSTYASDPARGDTLVQYAAATKTKRYLLHLIDGDKVYLNYYGPPLTLPSAIYAELSTMPMDEVARLLRGKAVFIGQAESQALYQRENDVTAHSWDDGPDLPAVEIAASHSISQSAR